MYMCACMLLLSVQILKLECMYIYTCCRSIHTCGIQYSLHVYTNFIICVCFCHTQCIAFDEYLFTAGNDSAGTASITYTSRLSPQPVTVPFHHFSFPSSCSSHPSRCRELMYSSSTNKYNQIVRFFVPLSGSSLGVTEFIHDGTKLSLGMNRTIALQGRCSPIAVVKISGKIRLVCVGDRQRPMSCEVRNGESVDRFSIVCTPPLGYFPLSNLSLLSNFVAYGINRHEFLYFTYGDEMYAIHPVTYAVEPLSRLYPTFSHCRHLELVQNSASPQIASYCYLASDSSQIQVAYFDLNSHSFVSVQSNGPNVVRYDCPSPGTVVEVSNNGAYASFWRGETLVGSFTIVGDSVKFAECFEYENVTHFVYQDRRLGTFIKPNISVDLQSDVKHLSTLVCHSPVCERLFVFDDKYVLFYGRKSGREGWIVESISGQSVAMLRGGDPSQFTLISDFAVRIDDPTTSTNSPPTSAEHRPRSVMPHRLIIGSSAGSGGGLIAIIVIIIVVTVSSVHFYRQRRLVYSKFQCLCCIQIHNVQAIDASLLVRYTPS